MADFQSSKRSRRLNNPKPKQGKCVIYLMSRDQRAHHNWALLEAQHHADHLRIPLIVAFILYKPAVEHALPRQYRFMIEGLRVTAMELDQHNIPFVLCHSSFPTALTQLVSHYEPAAIYCDHSPLRGPQTVRQHIAKEYPHIPSYTVDAHNIIPAWITSQKQEWAAYTIRPKIHKLLPDFLTPFPKLKKQTHALQIDLVDWNKLLSNYPHDNHTGPDPGSRAAYHQLEIFVKNGITSYDANRNDAIKNGQSGLSPYLHFGQISAQHIASYVLEHKKQMLQIGPKITQRSLCKDKNVAAFLEELIVRRELSDNFCMYNKHYDTIKGAPDWAIQTLGEHTSDSREFIYPYETFELGTTHDELWNAAQRQMVATGKMHGYMRMYWAKKILEWTPSADIAINYAIRLNDTYELDGRDPNGYVGILWSIAGLHDRPWFNRPIYGTVRYMARSGCEKKFDTVEYIRRYTS